MNVSSIYARSGSHSYSGLAIADSEDLSALARKLHDILADATTTDTILNNFETLGLAGFSDERLNEIANLDLPSSHFTKWRTGEALAQVLLEENYSCWIPFSKEANTTNFNTSTTGIDLLGIATDTAGNMLLLFAEVKTSSEAVSPPQIVHSSKKDCLTNQLKDIIKNKNKRDDHMRYLAKEFGTSHPEINRFVEAVRAYMDDKYAIYGLVVRDTDPNKDDLEITSDALISDSNCDDHDCVLLSLNTDKLDQIVEMVQAA